jgi:hypothetical protein
LPELRRRFPAAGLAADRRPVGLQSASARRKAVENCGGTVYGFDLFLAFLAQENGMSEVASETGEAAGEGNDGKVLVVASKVKKLIKDKSGMNTSGTVMEALSKVIERECSRAIERAQADKRKTVMDRDFGL